MPPILFWGQQSKGQVFPAWLQCWELVPVVMAALSHPLQPVGKIGQKGLSWGCTASSNATSDLIWSKMPTVLEKGVVKTSI